MEGARLARQEDVVGPGDVFRALADTSRWSPRTMDRGDAIHPRLIELVPTALPSPAVSAYRYL
jgi:hypothetical protein